MNLDAAERLGRVFLAEGDERLVARAMDTGLVSQEQVGAARRMRDEAGGEPPLADLLVARGWLAAEALTRLRDDEEREAFGRGATADHPPLPAEAATWDAEPERQFGEFVLVARLGVGGAGEVWKAWDRRVHRWVALKISTLALASTSARERFEREAVASGRLAHPNILPIFQVGNARGRPFLVMPFIDGQPLDQMDPRSLPIRRAVEIVCAAAGAVEHAHGRGIVHRDLKPGNMMIERGTIASGEGGLGPPEPIADGVFILDFGLAYLKEDRSSRLTQPGEVMGTASYMAPEQARGGAEAVQPTVDVHGLGATLYFLLTGQAPFVGPSLDVVVGRVLTDTPETPRRLRPEVDRRLERVVGKAMAKDPGQRYPTAAALAEDLRRWLDDQPIRARAAPLSLRLSRTLRRPGTAAAVGLLAVVAAAAVGATLSGATGLQARSRHEGRAALAPRCGNGRIDPGEDCDPGIPGTVGCTPGCLHCTGRDARYVWPDNGHCYTRHDRQLPWAEASALCRGMGAYLMTDTSKLGAFSVREHLLKSGTQQSWVGAYDAKGEGLYRWITGEPVGDFSPTEQQAAPGGCVATLASMPPGQQRFLAVRRCDQPLPFICEKPAWVEWGPSGHGYRQVPEEKTFEGAAQACAAIGGHILTVNSEEENLFSMRFAGHVWLGARRTATEADFRWVTSEPFAFRNFAPGEPDILPPAPDCVVRGVNPMWHDRHCDVRGTLYGVVCEAE